MTNRSAIDSAIAKMKKEFGDRTVIRAGDQEIVPVNVISTGILSFDRALRCGGWPRGRIVEIYGWESSCKTGITLKTIAGVQAAGGQALFIDAERSLDLMWAERAYGVNPESLVVAEPETCEDAFSIIESFVREQIDIVVVDSVEGLVPKAEIDASYGESVMGVKGRLMSQGLRKLAQIVSASDSVVIFISQLRQKIGIVYGNPDVTTGGNGLKMWASVRVEAKKSQPIKEGDIEAGTKVRVKVIKSKVGPARDEAEFDHYYGKCECHAPGFDINADLLEAGVAAGVIEKAAANYSFAGERIATGRENAAKQFANVKLADAVRAAIRKAGA